MDAAEDTTEQQTQQSDSKHDSPSATEDLTDALEVEENGDEDKDEENSDLESTDTEGDGKRRGVAWFRKRKGGGVSVAVQGLHVFVKDRNPLTRLWKKGPRTQEILHDVSCCVKPGQLLAILGSSGSGKTTLLNALAGRLKIDGWKGYLSLNPTDVVASSDVLFNGKQRSPSEIRRIAAYVMQKDYMLPFLTVRQALTYAGLLSLPQTLTKTKKLEIVENVILELGLKDCATTKIGGENSHGISGGERRRVSIALQLLTDPSVLLLDEPTSGLDSFTANKLMNTLLEIAHQGRTVICTIHQPRSEMMLIFDLVLLLSKGKVVYFGDSSDTVAYFDEHGHICPPQVNPADYFLDLMTIDQRSEEAEKISKQRLDQLCQAWEDSPEFVQLTQEIEQEKQSRAGNINADDEEKLYSLRTQLPAYKALPILIRRNYTNVIHNPGAAFTRIGQVLAMSVIFVICFLRINHDQIGVQNMLGFLYEILSLLFVGQLIAISLFPVERDVFYRERIDGLYGTMTFLLSYMSVELPFDLVSLTGACSFTYFVIGLNINDAWRFFVFYGVCLSALFTGETMGMLLCSLFGNVGIANMLSATLFSLLLLMCGFFRSQSTLPYPLRYLNYVFITKYCGEVLAINQFQGLSISCPASQSINGTCTYTNGDEVITSLGFHEDHLWPYFGVMLFLAVLYRFIVFLTLKLKPVRGNV